MSLVVNFIQQTLSFLVHSKNCIVQALNYSSLNMWWMTRVTVEVAGNVDRFSVNLRVQCKPFSDNRNIQKGIVVFDSVSIVNCMEDHRLLRRGRYSVIHLDQEDRPPMCHLYARAMHHVKSHQQNKALPASASDSKKNYP